MVARVARDQQQVIQSVDEVLLRDFDRRVSCCGRTATSWRSSASVSSARVHCPLVPWPRCFEGTEHANSRRHRDCRDLRPQVQLTNRHRRRAEIRRAPGGARARLRSTQRLDGRRGLHLRRRRDLRRRVRQAARVRPADERADAAAALSGPRHVGGVTTRARSDRDRVRTQATAPRRRPHIFLSRGPRAHARHADRLDHVSLAAFADELEREKARQRAYDAMRRKAAPRQVTGGQCFGYRNVEVTAPGPDGRPKGQYVRRELADDEAASFGRSSNCARWAKGSRTSRNA
jgi:hypothetical protein